MFSLEGKLENDNRNAGAPDNFSVYRHLEHYEDLE